MFLLLFSQSCFVFETHSVKQEATTGFLKSLLLFQTLNKGMYI